MKLGEETTKTAVVSIDIGNKGRKRKLLQRYKELDHLYTLAVLDAISDIIAVESSDVKRSKKQIKHHIQYIRNLSPLRHVADIEDDAMLDIITLQIGKAWHEVGTAINDSMQRISYGK